jgi:SAM-dependent methyltransferase
MKIPFWKPLYVWYEAQLVPQFRAPQRGYFGWMARRFMNKSNAPSAVEGMRRLRLQASDVLVELGPGHGHALRAIPTVGPIPQRIVAVEVSPAFRDGLAKLQAQQLPAVLAARLEIVSNDAKDLKFLPDCSVDKVFALNVVYFLDPLQVYLTELHRILKPGGVLVWACKFPSIAKLPDDIFINKDEGEIVAAMQAQGFVVTSTMVDVGGPLYDYTELKGIKS